MARTAPAPNIPAIPGMNPGAFVMGGGGDGGGSGAGGGGAGGGGAGGGPGKGGAGAGGGGKGAGSCGPGSGAGCPNPAHGGKGGAAAGDPVDVATGRVYTMPALDLVLPGPLPLLVQRSYSTSAIERDIGLGYGWTHSLSWEVEVRHGTLTVQRPDGTASSHGVPIVGQEVDLGNGGRLRRDGETFVVVDSDGQIYLFTPINASRWRVGAILDLNGNRVELTYRDGSLAWLHDSAGRVVRVRRHTDGHIAAFEVNGGSGLWSRFKSYEYDNRGDLIAVIDGEGHALRFTYDEDHRLSRQTYAAGLNVFYHYDARGRCVETWCSYSHAKDPALSDDVPELLADRRTRAKGIFHCKLEYAKGFTEVIDSRQVRRYESNAFGKIDKASTGSGIATLSYDKSGNITSYVDALGAATAYDRDDTGRMAEIIDPSGARTEFQYNARGNLTEVVSALGQFVRYAYDDFSNLIETTDALGSLIRYEYDGRGQRVRATMPDGAVTEFRHDAQGNLVELVEPHGKPRRLVFDELGRVTSFVNEEGHPTSFAYNGRGQLCAVHLPNGAVQAVEYNPDGRLARLHVADGGTYELFWGGYGVVHELRRPDGQSIRFRYDRECNLVQVINERDEVHRILRDGAGRIIEEESFDGRRSRYRLDEAGRMARIENGAGQATTFTRDVCGRIVERVYADDSTERFEYDAVGRLIGAENADVRCTFAHDDRGRLVRETQTFGARTHGIENEYTVVGKRSTRRTSLGHVTRTDHDRMGLPVRVFLDTEAPITFTWNALDAEVTRALPNGGTISSRYDALGFLAERHIVAPRTPNAKEPDWVGRLPPGTTHAVGYHYSRGGDILEEDRADKGKTDFRYDPNGRILARIPAHAQAEIYGYGAGGTLQDLTPGAAPRTYGPGGKLLSLNGTHYRYDEESRLVEKRQNGNPKPGWRYEWSARGLLAAVVAPDGTRVENVYDPFARRIAKRVIAPDGTGGLTRFVWDGDVLVHEIHETGGTLLLERTYAFRSDGPFPLAHRDRTAVDGVLLDAGWVHYANGMGEHPGLLVAGSGEILAEISPNTWGNVPSRAMARARTPLRYPGQYFDEETGLAYNRYRFYDPETGRYISADPIGLSGGLEPFTYAHQQPFRIHDPLGLAPVTCTVSGSAGSYGAASGGPPGDIHPVVEGAFPPRAPDNNTGIYPRFSGGDPPGQSPTACGEPRALSGYIKAWEKQHNDGRQLDPNKPADHEKIQTCLGSINGVSSTQAGEGGSSSPRAPCANCSQLLANLNQKYGEPNPGVIQPGATSKDGTDSTNFSPPNPDWVKGQQQAIQAGGGQSGPQPAVVKDKVPAPTGPAFPPHSGYGILAP